MIETGAWLEEGGASVGAHPHDTIINRSTLPTVHRNKGFFLVFVEFILSYRAKTTRKLIQTTVLSVAIAGTFGHGSIEESL